MSAPLALGVVGCGDIAGYVAFFARLNPRLRLAACCDTNLERAQAFARQHRVAQIFTDYANLLEQARLDAVYVAVPHHLHAPMIEMALQRGLPVWTEKPLTRTLAEGQQVVRLAAQYNVKVGVNYQYRYDAGCYALARAAQQGALGQIHAARVNIPWRREPAYFEKSPWHAAQAAAGGGTLLTQGSHFLDIALWAAGSPPVSALGYTARRRFKDVEVEDLAQGVVELADGALLQVNSTMAAAVEGAVTIELYGSLATAVYTSSPRPQVRFRRARGVPPPPAARPPTWWLPHALARSLEGFRRWVVHDHPAQAYLCPADQALPALAVVEAIYRSAQSGVVQPL